MSVEFDVAVIGAGPSGSVASALLNKQGFKVCVLENNISHALSSAKACCRIVWKCWKKPVLPMQCMPSPAFNLKTALRFHGAAVTQISTLLKNFQTAPVLFIKYAAASSTKS